MGPSDIDGRPGDETPGQMLTRLIAASKEDPYVSLSGNEGESRAWVLIDGRVNLDDVAAQFKAAILAGQV